MCLSDTAEYWWDVKAHYNRNVPNYYHIPGYKCGHHHYFEAKYVDEVNCKACKKALEEGIQHTLKSEEEHNKIWDGWWKKYPTNPECPKCGFPLIKRVNKITKKEFWGCCQFPNCKSTKEI